MSTINLVAIAIVLAAVIGLCFDVHAARLFGLLTVAAMVGATDAAYHQNNHFAVGLLALSFVLAVLSARAAFRGSSTGRGQR